jgi:hypothetical protein
MESLDMKVIVNWMDSYLEEFEASEVRFGSDLLWMRLSNGSNRHIPTRQVRLMEMTIKDNLPIIEECNIKVTIRWFDGYLREFKCCEFRFGTDNLYLKLTKSTAIYIPSRQVRWYSSNPESHENVKETSC